MDGLVLRRKQVRRVGLVGFIGGKSDCHEYSMLLIAKSTCAILLQEVLSAHYETTYARLCGARMGKL